MLEIIMLRRKFLRRKFDDFLLWQVEHSWLHTLPPSNPWLWFLLAVFTHHPPSWRLPLSKLEIFAFFLQKFLRIKSAPFLYNWFSTSALLNSSYPLKSKPLSKPFLIWKKSVHHPQVWCEFSRRNLLQFCKISNLKFLLVNFQQAKMIPNHLLSGLSLQASSLVVGQGVGASSLA